MLHFTFPPHETALFNHLFTNPVETDKALRETAITVDHFSTRASKGLFHNLWPHLYRCTLPSANRQHDRHRALLELRGRIHRQLTNEDIDRLNVPALMPLDAVIAALGKPRVPELPLPLGFIIANQSPVSPAQPALDQSAQSPLPAPRSAPVSDQDQAQRPTQPTAPPPPTPHLLAQPHSSHPSSPSHSTIVATPPQPTPISEHAPAPHATVQSATPPPDLRLQPHSRSFASVSGQNSEIRTETPAANQPLMPAVGCEPPAVSFPTRNQKPDTRKPFSSKKKPRPNDRLGNLSEEDQAQILSWIQDAGIRGTVKIIAKPRPEGLGLKIHCTSLRGFYRKHTRPSFELDPEYLAAIPDVSKDPVFAEICHKLEEEILVGLDCSEGRAETMRLLSIYLRYRALLQKASNRTGRARFSQPMSFFQNSFPETPAPRVPQAPAPETEQASEQDFSPAEQHFKAADLPSFSPAPAQQEGEHERRGDQPSTSPICASPPEQDFCATEQHFAEPETGPAIFIHTCSERGQNPALL